MSQVGIKMLSGQIAIITGGGSGIGRAICQLFAEEGATVVAADINEQNAEETVLNIPGYNHTSLKVDVSKREDIEGAIITIKSKYGSIPTIAVNCAGVPFIGSVLDITDEDYYRLMDVNFKGVVLMTQVMCREWVSSACRGSMVNIASIITHLCLPFTSLYTSSKAAVESFTKSAAKEMAKHEIRINSVLPGAVQTPMLDSVSHHDCIPRDLLGNPADPREIAQVVLFLVSDRASHVSASSYTVTGGFC